MIIPFLHIHQLIRFGYNIGNGKTVLRVNFHRSVGKRRPAFQSVRLMLTFQNFRDFLYTGFRIGTLFPIKCHDELITAQTENHIFRAQTTPGCRRNKLKYLVAFFVSITVIDPIQAV